jgi:hypothetical protein
MEVVFQASHNGLVIPFIKPIGKDDNGRPQVRRPIVFKKARCVLDDERDVDLPAIERLREAKGNKANGGTSFWELRQSDISAVMANEGKTYAKVPENGVQESDIAAFNYLRKLPNALPPAAKNKAFEIANTLYDRFLVAGVPRPDKEHKPKRLKACITLILDTLEDRGILGDVSNIEGEADS